LARWSNLLRLSAVCVVCLRRALEQRGAVRETGADGGEDGPGVTGGSVLKDEASCCLEPNHSTKASEPFDDSSEAPTAPASLTISLLDCLLLRQVLALGAS